MTVDSPEPAGAAEPPKANGEKNSFGRRWDYAGTFATEFAVMLSQVIVYKLAATWLGQTGFSEYALARRILALLQPVVMLGIGVGLPRYLALADGRGDSSRSARYLAAALLCVGGFTAVVAGFLLVFRRWSSYVLFGSVEHAYLMPAVAFMLIGVSAHGILYAFLRGQLAIRQANTLQLLNNCVLPLVVFTFFHKDVIGLLWGFAVAWTGTATIMLVLTRVTGHWTNPVGEISELMSYGLQRVPGDFALMALLALPAIFAAHLGGIHQAGLVAFALSVVNMIASLFTPIGIILLPKVSQAVGGGDLAPVRHEIALIVRLTLVLSAFIVVLVELLGGRLIRIYLGQSYGNGALIVNILVLGALPLGLYYAMRSVIDAVHRRAINAANLLISLGLFLAGSGLAQLYYGNTRGFLWSFVAALALLALLTQREIKRIFASRPALPDLGVQAAEIDID
jgi:O-antigen/teichoic acid export membrane protein